MIPKRCQRDANVKLEEKDDAGVHMDSVSPGPFDETPHIKEAFLFHYNPAMNIVMPKAVCRRLGPSRTSESGENYREAGCDSDVRTLENLKADMRWQFGMNTPFLRPGPNREAYRKPYTPEEREKYYCRSVEDVFDITRTIVNHS